jgi:ubiquinone/menaquinone biosynthesis C-methylase UbiE
MLRLGTLDSLFCGPSSYINTRDALTSISRVLSSGGVYIVISHSDEKSRRPHLDKPYEFYLLIIKCSMFNFI